MTFFSFFDGMYILAQSVSEGSDCVKFLYFLLPILGILFGTAVYFYAKARSVVKLRNAQNKGFSMLNSVVNMAGVSFFTCDKNFNITYICKGNDFFVSEKTSGKESVFVAISRNFDLSKKFSDIQNFKSGKTQRLELNFSSEFGEEKHYSFLMQKSDDTDEYVGTITDITALYKTQKEAEQANIILEYVLNNIPFPIFVKNYSKGGKYILINKHFYNFIGITDTNPVKDRTDYDIFEHHLAKKFQDLDLGIISRGVIEDSNITIHNKSGTEQTNRVILCPMKSPYGEDYLMGIAIDVTKLIDVQKQLESYVERGKILNNALSNALSSDVEASTLDNFLKDIGVYLKADRANIYIFDDKNKGAKLQDEWCKEGVPPTPSEYKTIPIANTSADMQEIKNGKILATNDISGVEVSRFHEIDNVLQSSGVKSAFTMGIFHRDSLWGVMGFDYVEAHTITKEDYETALSACKVFELYLNRRENLKVLRESEAEKALILESLHFPIMLFDKNRNLKTVNVSASKIVGEDIKTILTKPCYETFCKQDNPNCHVSKCLADSTAQMMEVFLPNGTIYHAHAHPVFDKDGKIEYALEYMMDVTELVNSKKNLEDAVRNAQAAEKAKDLFLSTMSHEIRTPLNAVIGYSELNQYDHISDQERLENLKSINFAANSLLALINDILDLSKLEAGFVEMNPQPLNLKEFLGDIVRIFKYRATLKDVDIILNIDANIPIVKLDSMRLKQVLMNLVGNAVKFTDSGSVIVGCKFKPAAGGKINLFISVKDTGMGISSDYIWKIFNPFERQHMDIVTGKQAHEGTGLGLPIAKRLVENMNGKISVESVLGKGSNFNVTLEDVEISDEEYISKSQTLTHEDADFNFTGEVLIVDDIAMNLAVFGAILKKLGVKYKSANSAKIALEMIAQHKPDIVLTDIWMPDMGGSELLEAIKTDEKTKDIIVVAVTADTRFHSLGFDDKLFKPITIDSVSKLIMSFADKINK